MKRKIMKLWTMALLFGGTMPIANAGENLWMYSRGTDVRPAGSTEIKFSNISRLGKKHGDYTFHDIRPEIEYGITDRLTVGIELMYFMHDYSVTQEIGPMFETQGNEEGFVAAGTPAGRFKQNKFGGLELNMKYNIYSPYKDWMGLSLGLSYEDRNKYRLDGGEIDQDSWVGTVFLQKDFLDDTLVFVVNTKMELERRKGGGVLEEEIAFDLSAGVSYRFAKNWFGGLEFRRQEDHLSPWVDGQYDDPNLKPSNWDLGNFQIGTRHQYGNYFGPSLHFAQEKWWATVASLWQVSGGGSEHAFVEDNKNWDEHEEVHVGFNVGFEF